MKFTIDTSHGVPIAKYSFSASDAGFYPMTPIEALGFCGRTLMDNGFGKQIFWILGGVPMAFYTQRGEFCLSHEIPKKALLFKNFKGVPA